MSSDQIRHRLSVAITAAAVVLGAGHLLFPFIAIDAITLTLLVVAVAPWLGHVFKAFELPGVGRFEYHELVQTEAEVKDAGLTAPATSQQEEALPPSLKEDPHIALAGLRIELERRLRRLAKLKGLDVEKRPGSIRMLAGVLGSSGLITDQQVQALSGMAGTLDRAVHARSVDAEAADWALTVGPTVLASLDQRISTVASSNNAS